MKIPASVCAIACAAACLAQAQAIDTLTPQVRKYLRVATPKVVLEHVQVIDGTGAPPAADRNIHIAGGKITAITPGADEPPSEGTTVLDLGGRSVMPGIVGMHNHLFFMAVPRNADGSVEAPALFVQMSFSAPRMYLASGVTTARTVASIEPQTEVKLKAAIEAGKIPGPHLDVTGPFLEGMSGNPNLQIRELTGADDARETVAYWAERGVTSFKAYADITRDELRAVVAEAHKRGLKVTGHLCSVTYEEAAEIGIDNLEHGFAANTGLDPAKKPDTCTDNSDDYTLEHMTPDSAEARRLFATLLKHRVAVTSTLVNASLGARPPSERIAARPALLEAMSPSVRAAYERWFHRPAGTRNNAFFLRRDVDLQRAFVAAGGLLISGSDPVGIGDNIPGFGDQRQIELLVEGGFTPVQAIRIATLNGATYLGRDDRIGSIAVGKNADLVVVKGDPATRIADIENVEIVFKDGAGYDPAKLLDAVKGKYGEY
jgi:imidazolonepropionase-like amidohydrolase